jgi:hypothetical protein
VEKAGISVSQTAGGDEQRNRHWDGQVYREGVTEALDHDFARKFACEAQKKAVKKGDSVCSALSNLGENS